MNKYNKICPIHGDTIHSVYRNGNSGNREYCNKCQTEKVMERVEKHREMAYNEFGRECKVCKYNRCLNALEYHHLDPNKKDGQPSKIMYRSWENIKKELSGCIILCANCHREVHAGLINIEDYL